MDAPLITTSYPRDLAINGAVYAAFRYVCDRAGDVGGDRLLVVDEGDALDYFARFGEEEASVAQALHRLACVTFELEWTSSRAAFQVVEAVEDYGLTRGIFPVRLSLSFAGLLARDRTGFAIEALTDNLGYLIEERGGPGLC
jgi:hypothetical protein